MSKSLDKLNKARYNYSSLFVMQDIQAPRSTALHPCAGQISTGVTWDQRRTADTVDRWKRLLELGAPRRFPARSEILREGERPRQLFLIDDGLVLLTRGVSDGGEGIMAMRLPGQFVCAWAWGLHMSYPVSARTAVPSRIHVIDEDEFQRRKRTDPEISELFEEALHFEISVSCAFIADMQVLRPEDRFQHLLTLFASLQGQAAQRGPVRLTMPLRDDEI